MPISEEHVYGYSRFAELANILFPIEIFVLVLQELGEYSWQFLI